MLPDVETEKVTRVQTRITQPRKLDLWELGVVCAILVGSVLIWAGLRAFSTPSSQEKGQAPASEKPTDRHTPSYSFLPPAYPEPEGWTPPAPPGTRTYKILTLEQGRITNVPVGTPVWIAIPDSRPGKPTFFRTWVEDPNNVRVETSLRGPPGYRKMVFLRPLRKSAEGDWAVYKVSVDPIPEFPIPEHK